MGVQLNIRISKESDVTIHDQLVAEITFLIATGELKPGETLPSVRTMARRLKTHHNTVSQAYQDLAASDMLLRRRGSCMVVRTPGEVPPPPRVKDLDDLINATVRTALEKGYNLQQLRLRVQERLMAQPPVRILVVSIERGMRHLLREELREMLPFPVEACSLDDLSLHPELTMGTLVVGTPGAISKMTSLVPKDHPRIPITFSSASKQVKMVNELREPSAIAVVSISEMVLRIARGVLAPHVGHQHTIREYLLPEQNPSNLSATDLVICDIIAHRRVKARRPVPYRLISAACLEQLSRAMEP
jgi:DNA-binding transcriptional regulator YhcF (GntR family)